MAENTQVLLARRPEGKVRVEDFSIVRSAVPEPGPGEVLLRHLWLSLDPYQRGRMSAAKSYAQPVAVGAVMECRAVARVEKSNDPALKPGDIVLGAYGWQEWSVASPKELMKLDPAEAPVQTALGILGMPGLTAHVGMSDIGQPKRGETVVISAASGAVGAVAGQIAKAEGARVIGIAGGAAKCAYVREELGFDACLDHRDADFIQALDAACPKGVDVYWENVGGAVQRAVFPRLADFARMVMCGMIAEYNDPVPQPGPNLMSAVRKRLRIQGFIVSDSWQRLPEWRAAAIPLIRAGKLRYREDVVDGIEAAPEAFIGLLEGRNFGKLLIKVG
ncbi:NADP-dependent oxidoreductase [Elioraea rosea]|uniref:NADP-dependent oxidoreductase n=1 Tax=Elioraea rosea TaxID=2492390 RepID=UPI001182F7EF|nr:NADP-dependent oxidoreductase [Elioraea rosea]